jgi:pimeloyl-ACP methyl ester carboxylesterase
MMFFRDEGEGEPVLLVHGLGASGRVFDPVFASRRGDRRLIAIDLPRTGRSKRWSASEPKFLAEALARWLTERSIAKAHVFGHSFGGLVALSFATRFPDRVLSLTVASVPALGLPPEFRLLLDNPVADLSMGFFGALPAVRPLLRAYLRFIWGEPATIAPQHLEIYEEALRAEGFAQGMLEALRAVGHYRLDAPTLLATPFPKQVLWGEKDPLVPAMQGERLARAIGAQLTVLTNVGHCVPEERPDAVHDALYR